MTESQREVVIRAAVTVDRGFAISAAEALYVAGATIKTMTLFYDFYGLNHVVWSPEEHHLNCKAKEANVLVLLLFLEANP